MFTGIIESTGEVSKIVQESGNLQIWLKSPISQELRIDQSLSHNGICLTIDQLQNGEHRFTAISETISKTNIKHWKTGDLINLERCVSINGRLDGHLVQGHIDCTANCTNRTDADGSQVFEFTYPSHFAGLLIEKGSVCINGISLTCFNLKENRFSVAIIPYTLEHTNMKSVQPGDEVNIEFDMVGKYINRMQELKQTV